MNETLLLENIFTFAKKYLHDLEPAIGIPHMETTLQFTQEIALKEEANINICSIAAILHDIGLSVNQDMENETIDNNHGIQSAKIVRPFLTELQLPEQVIDEICIAISSHCFPNNQKTLNAKILWDADKLSIFSKDMQRIYIDYWKDKGFSDEKARLQIKQAKDYFLNTFYTKTAKDIAELNINS